MLKEILILRAHGANVPGKCSPDWGTDSPLAFKEWIYSKEMCGRLHEELDSHPEIVQRDIAVTEVIGEFEDNEPALSVLRSRCNKPNAFLIALHNNAAGCSGWKNARGFSIWTSRGKTKSDACATIIFDEFEAEFPELQVRKDTSDGDPDYESNFNVLMFTPPAVLLETLFQDNKEDVAVLKSEDFKIRFIGCLSAAIVRIIKEGVL